MSDGPRARNRAAIEAAILEVGTRHLAEHGAAALSLRAVARELGMASSAVYRYVDSRDELLTRLIVSAYDSLGDAVDRALDTTPGTGPGSGPVPRFRTVARTFRAWAHEHPHQYSLLYGSPVPDYDAPADRTTIAGTRVQVRLVEVLTQLPSRGRVTRSQQAAAGWLLEDPMVDGLGLDADRLTRGLTAWTLVVGAVSSEVFQQYGRDAAAAGEPLFEAMLESAVAIVEGTA